MTPEAERLAARSTRFVYAIAHEHKNRWRREFDEAVADGMLGLCKAAEAFDPDRGVPFGSFARQRILGAMIDGWRTRHHWRRAGRVGDELSLDVLIEDGWEGRKSVRSAESTALAGTVGEDIIIDLIRGMSDRHQRIAAHLVDANGERMGDTEALGAELGIHPTRVSQLRRDIRERVGRAVA